MFRLYGITPDQFGSTYESWQASVHPEDRQRAHEENQLALQDTKDFDTEFRVVWSDGSIHSIRALVLVQRDATGQPLHMDGTNWDIKPKSTQRRNYGAATANSRRQPPAPTRWRMRPPWRMRPKASFWLT